MNEGATCQGKSVSESCGGTRLGALHALTLKPQSMQLPTAKRKQ